MKMMLLLTLVVFFAGCATATPKELINARAAYQQASEGPAARLAPAELHKAHMALAKAEQSFDRNSDSYITLDLAYVAQRRAELAGVLGTMAADKASKVSSDSTYSAEQAAIAAKAKLDLVDAEQAASDQKSAQQLSDSEARTAAALAELAKLAAVKEEERGLVITLSGGVLFRSSEWALLPSARTKLDQVAAALMAAPKRRLIVEGHTDSQGSAAYNQDLSQRRAEAVRDYLIQRGYSSSRIVAHGMGMGNPVADNTSAEGRANNRRVEIVIERGTHASSN